MEKSTIEPKLERDVASGDNVQEPPESSEHGELIALEDVDLALAGKLRLVNDVSLVKSQYYLKRADIS